MGESGYTPVETRILELLKDGSAHNRWDVHACLTDELGAVSNVQPHISRLRKKLRSHGQFIVCEIVHRKICYRWVRLLPGASGQE